MKYGVWYLSENGWVFWSSHHTVNAANDEAAELRNTGAEVSVEKISYDSTPGRIWESVLWKKGQDEKA